VHVRHVRVRPGDDVAFTWHDEELAGSSGKVSPSEHVQEALSRRKGGGIGRRRT
jgi:plastocyanin